MTSKLQVDRVAQDRVAQETRDDPAAKLRRYWDQDASTYDQWREHGAWSSGERAAWTAALARLLPPPGARLLDIGAGTGFLSLAAARMGYDVTALDVSARMLDRLKWKAEEEGLSIKAVCAPAHEPPPGPFDAVMERLTLWTLPDPARALGAWREVTSGQLVAFECVWSGRDYVEGLRRRARGLLHRWRGLGPEHHAAYERELRDALPMIGDVSPGAMVDVITAAGWDAVQLSRLRDVEWARTLALPPLDRLLGVTPEYVIVGLGGDGNR